MKILHLSDTHGSHRKLKDLPKADVVVHSGDITMAGSEEEVADFIRWFDSLPYRRKIFIAGNHDDSLYEGYVGKLQPNIHYLRNSGIEIDGLKFYGVPMFMEDCMSEMQEEFYYRIPSDTDVLITHAPAFGILDFGYMHQGSKALREIMSTLRLKAHIFGHIHDNPGIKTINGVIFSNASIVSPDYRPINCPKLIDLS
ncbi:MAG: metallophosphatase domain-containing protein [Muribaculaceae bacterium]|nr:metallophosphatase domain-containing protein [Muribaculaceae bacterium]